MDLTATIDGGLKSLGNNLGNSFLEYNSFRKKSNLDKFSKLKIGEIVFGKVLYMMQNDLAMIKLPIGTFSSYVHSNLKSGDELYFKVEATNPNLLLKVHSVSKIVNNIELSTIEILRILDIEHSEFNNQIVKFFKAQKSKIYRNDILQLNNYIHKFNYNFSNYQNEVTINTLCNMIESGIEPEIEIFKSLYDGFYGELNLQKIIDEFIDSAKLLPINSKSRLLKHFDFIDKEKFNICKSFCFFSQTNTDETFYQLLQKILQLSSVNKNFIRLQDLSKQIIRIADSQNIWNMIALSAGSAFRISIPIKQNSNTKILTLAINCNKNQKNVILKDNNHFEEEYLFDLYGYLCNSICAKQIICESSNELEILINNINNAISNLGFNIISYNTNNNAYIEVSRNQNKANEIKSKKISVVI